MNQNFAHETGNIGRNTHDICADLAVACPWRIHIIVPKMPAKQPCHCDHDEGEEDPAGMCKELFHSGIPFKSTALTPRMQKYMAASNKGRCHTKR
ncbi:hypothetical protein D9M69_653510 [compost metagenome]